MLQSSYVFNFRRVIEIAIRELDVCCNGRHSTLLPPAISCLLPFILDADRKSPPHFPGSRFRFVHKTVVFINILVLLFDDKMAEEDKIKLITDDGTWVRLTKAEIDELQREYFSTNDGGKVGFIESILDRIFLGEFGIGLTYGSCVLCKKKDEEI